MKAIFLTLLSGVTTGIGAFFGAIVGGISKEVISICLAFAAGAMLYIVSGELIPESNNIYKGRMGAIGNILRIYSWCSSNANLELTKGKKTTIIILDIILVERGA